MYVVLDGTVSVEMRGGFHAELGPGNFFGEIAPSCRSRAAAARVGRDARAPPQRAQGRLHQARRERAAVRADDAARARAAPQQLPVDG